VTYVSLKQAAEAKANGFQKATYFKLDPNVVKIEEGWNGRDETPDLLEYRQRLKQAMKAGAMIPPIDVEMVDGEPIVRDGHSRTLMARELVAEGVPYVLEARQFKGNEAEARYHMIGSAGGRALSPLEQGRQFKLLVSYGQTVADISNRTGMHRSTVENGLQLADAPVAVQKLVTSGKVASHLALKAVRQHGKEAAAVLKAGVEKAEAAGKTKATAKHVSPMKGRKVPLAEPGARGQTLPPASAQNDLFNLAMSLAAVNILVTELDRDTIAGLVQKARTLVGMA